MKTFLDINNDRNSSRNVSWISFSWNQFRQNKMLNKFKFFCTKNSLVYCSVLWSYHCISHRLLHNAERWYWWVGWVIILSWQCPLNFLNWVNFLWLLPQRLVCLDTNRQLLLGTKWPSIPVSTTKPIIFVLKVYWWQIFTQAPHSCINKNFQKNEKYTPKKITR